MRKAFLLISVLFLAFSCVEKEDFASPSSEESTPLSKYALSGSDIFRLSDNTRAANPNSHIEYLTYKGDTVLYLLHKGNGFELYPSDQRFAPVIAFNESEDIDLDSVCPAQKEWFEQLKESIYNFRHFDSTTVNSNVDEWNHVLKRPKAVETRRGPDDPIDGGEGGNYGRWIFHNTTIVDQYDIKRSHLLSTLYSQDAPYNKYCPLNSKKTGHCAAGCITVATAQILFYLHQTFGWPLKTVESVSYDKSRNIYSFSDWSENAWNQNDVAEKLIGNIGVLANTNYGDIESSTPIKSIMNALYERYNIYSFYTTWNSDIIQNSITEKKPVSCVLYKKSETSSHTAVIDGFNCHYTRYADVYIYIEDWNSYHGDFYDHEDENPVPEEGPTYKEEYVSTSFYFQINWGWGENYMDNTYYHESCILVKGGHTYDGDRKIMYFQNRE